MYMDESETTEKVNESTGFVVVFAVAVALMIGLGIFPGPAIAFAQNAIPNIFAR